MNRYKFLVFAAILLFVLGAQTVSAQPLPWTVTAVQGSGQLICLQCNVQTMTGINNLILQNFAPLYVKVTDANGNPVPNANIIWSATNGGQYLNIPANNVTTTGTNGISSLLFTAPFTQQSQAGPVQSTVTATATGAGVSATFTLTQTAFNTQQTPQVNLDLTGIPVTGTTISGTAGSTGQAITVGVFGTGNTLLNPTVITGPIPGVSVKLVNYQSNATVTCAQGSGADPGSVLTDATGYATCNPIFSGSGSGQFAVLVGGVVLDNVNYSGFAPDYTAATPSPIPYVSPASPPSQPNATQPNFGGYSISAGINQTVIPATVSAISVVSGNNQTANQGHALAAPLVAQVNSTQGPLANQPVTWTVSPAGAATLTNASTTSGTNGQVSTNVTFSSTASGPVTVTVTSGGKSFAFTATATIPTTISGLTAQSGNNQTAIINTPFANPLVVHLTVSSGSVANQPVQFSVSGPAVLSATTATTDANGNASVNAQAQATAGAVTVTATAGGFTATFTLTVTPPGPQITANSFVNGADFVAGSISPCGIATVIGPGLAPNIQGVVTAYNIVGPLAYNLASVSVMVGGAQAPLYNVANMNGQQQVTFQVPCSVTPGAAVPVVVNVGGGSATVNVTVKPASPGVFQTGTNVTVPNYGSVPLAVIMKRDGTLVSPQNPARIGETVIAYVTGMGPTSPQVATNALPIFGTPSNVTGQVIVGVANAGVPVTFAQLSEDLIGVGLVAFQIPTGTPTGNQVFSIGLVPVGSTTPYYSAAAAIYIQ